MIPFVIWVLLLNASVFAQELVCAENYCTKNPCQDLDCDGRKGNRIVKNATTCGCCDICVEHLQKDDTCQNNLKGALPRVECGPSLVCDGNNKCSPDLSDCVKDSNKDRFEMSMTPQCDNFGEYQAVQCKQGMLCYCSSRNGIRIFGTAPYSEADNMKCSCSRDYDELARKPDKEDFLRCRADGSYDSLQCTDDYCFCRDRNGQRDGQAVNKDASIRNLKCYNSLVHREDFSSHCWQVRRNLTQQVAELEEDDLRVVGVDLPECDLDGSYAPVQCYGSKCYCVTRDGEKYDQPRWVDRYSEKAKNMNCRCKREKGVVDVTSEFAKYQCDPTTGNYNSMQCFLPYCFCVDEYGFQKSGEVLWSDKDSLSCNDNANVWSDQEPFNL